MRVTNALLSFATGNWRLFMRQGDCLCNKLNIKGNNANSAMRKIILLCHGIKDQSTDQEELEELIGQFVPRERVKTVCQIHTLASLDRKTLLKVLIRKPEKLVGVDKDHRKTLNELLAQLVKNDTAKIKIAKAVMRMHFKDMDGLSDVSDCLKIPKDKVSTMHFFMGN